MQPMTEPEGPVTVERREIDTIVVHGLLAGLVAGVVLGLVTIAGSLMAGGSIADPFRFATALAVGVEALHPDFSAAAAIFAGAAIHLALSAVLGVLFVGALAIGFQLSARPWLLIVYGALFAFTVWEVSFLAAVPLLFPFLEGQLDLGAQLANLAAYVAVHGPVLGAYVALVRPGVVGDWRAVGAPAGTWSPDRAPR